MKVILLREIPEASECKKGVTNDWSEGAEGARILMGVLFFFKKAHSHISKLFIIMSLAGEVNTCKTFYKKQSDIWYF